MESGGDLKGRELQGKTSTEIVFTVAFRDLFSY